MRRVSLWLPPLVYMILIFHFSSESSPMPDVTDRVWDKLLHATEYAGLAFLVCRALMGEGVGWLLAACAALLLTSAYGASDEWHQAFVPLRSVDVRDWLADTIGAALGAAIYVTGLTKRRRMEN
ncbi:MAG: VanZ family protein [Vicinamibacterales bacterium]